MNREKPMLISPRQAPCHAWRRRLLATVGALLLASVAALPVTAQTAEADFYRGKTLTVIVGYPPGGGYDAYARFIAANIGRHIPGNPNAVVQYMPGAASIRSANYLYV